jgi:ribosome-associated toxin RatA of RatAB toxin-antitoxin module
VSFDFQFSLDELSTLVKTKLLNGVFKNLRGIYEFTIHMHKVYQVPLDQNAKPEKEKVLLHTMESAFREYMKHFPNI